MDPERLSASSIATFEGCEARYQATYIEKGREMGGAAANLGTTVHAWLEWLVINGHYLTMSLDDAWNEFMKLASAAGLDAKQIIDAKQMIKRWWSYHEANGFNEVLCCEKKETFVLKHPNYDPIDVTYIWDRADLRKDGSIEIVDYKTIGQPVSSDNLRVKVQPRLYAVSAQMKFGAEYQPPFIWVTYWLLRFGEIGTRFTINDNRETYRYLQDVYRRIKESDGTKETINSECKWCVRKGTCSTLNAHTKVGGVLGMTPKQQALRLAETQHRLTALKALQEELETQLTDHLDQSELLEDTFDGVRIYIKPTKRREMPDKERIAKILGPELMTKYGELSMANFDDILKKEPLSNETRVLLKQCIRDNPGAQLKVEVTTPFDDL